MVADLGQPRIEPCYHHPLYLHFFDRELGASVSFTPTEQIIRDVTTCLLIASPAPLYCGLSPAWETLHALPGVAAFVTQLSAGGHLDLISNHPTKDEFLAARRDAYVHDAARYPMYFEDDHGPLEGLVPTVGKSTSATDFLRRELLVWTDNPPSRLLSAVPDQGRRNKLLKSVRTAIDKRDQQAVTFALFQPRLVGLQGHPGIGILRREISARYTDHNRVAQEGEIPTGIRGLSEYDRLSTSFPFYDVPLLGLIIENLGADALAGSADRWEDFLALRGRSAHMTFADRLRVFIAGLRGEVGLPLPDPTRPRERLRQAALRHFRSISKGGLTSESARDVLYDSIARLNTIIASGRSSPKFNQGVTFMEQEMHVADLTPILLVVATEVEHAAVLEAAQARGMGPAQLHPVGDHTYFILGDLGGCQLLLVKCDAGSGGAGGSLATLNDAVRDVKPDSIVMVGIAFGTKPDKHKMCDVLVSQQVMAYELQRVGEDKEGNITITPRGDKASAPPRIRDRFWAGSRDWKGANTHFGLIISGDKLIDSAKFRDKLLELEPEAIGGEMEAAGVYAAALKGHRDWIIVKAIVDWGAEKEKMYQAAAAKNAADLVFHVIEKGIMRR